MLGGAGEVNIRYAPIFVYGSLFPQVVAIVSIAVVSLLLVVEFLPYEKKQCLEVLVDLVFLLHHRVERL